MKTALNSSFCAVTADSKSESPHGRKARFRGLATHGQDTLSGGGGGGSGTARKLWTREGPSPQ